MNSYILSDFGFFSGDFIVLSIQQFIHSIEIRKQKYIPNNISEFYDSYLNQQRFLEIRQIDVEISGNKLEFVNAHPFTPRNYKNWGACLGRACLSGCLHLVWAVMEHRNQDHDWEGDDIWFQGLQGACISGNLEIVKLILSQMNGIGSKDKVFNLIHLTQISKQPHIVNFLKQEINTLIVAWDW